MGKPSANPSMSSWGSTTEVVRRGGRQARGTDRAPTGGARVDWPRTSNGEIATGSDQQKEGPYHITSIFDKLTVNLIARAIVLARDAD